MAGIIQRLVFIPNILTDQSGVCKSFQHPGGKCYRQSLKLTQSKLDLPYFQPSNRYCTSWNTQTLLPDGPVKQYILIYGSLRTSAHEVNHRPMSTKGLAFLRHMAQFAMPFPKAPRNLPPGLWISTTKAASPDISSILTLCRGIWLFP